MRILNTTLQSHQDQTRKWIIVYRILPFRCRFIRRVWKLFCMFFPPSSSKNILRSYSICFHRAPSIRSLKKAMQTYARQGGTSTIFINDDGLRLLPPSERDERLAFYANHNIGWVARPKHDPKPDGFKRAGRFKKASNMNYGINFLLPLSKITELTI